MSVGIIDKRTNPSQLNAVEFLWDPAKRTSAFIQVWIFYIPRGNDVTSVAFYKAMGKTEFFMHDTTFLKAYL